MRIEPEFAYQGRFELCAELLVVCQIRASLDK